VACVEAFVKANATIVKKLDGAKSALMQSIESQTLFDGFGCPYSAYGFTFVIKGRLLEAPKSVERERRLAFVDKLLRKLAMEHQKELSIDMAQARNELYANASSADSKKSHGVDGKQAADDDWLMDDVDFDSVASAFVHAGSKRSSNVAFSDVVDEEDEVASRPKSKKNKF
jgi:hypothetical protein